MSDHLRHLTVGLDLKQDYDILQEMDLSGCELTEKASVDVMLVDDRIRFLGWSLIDGEDHMEELERYLVFEDPFGKTYGARVLPQSRKDLVSYFGREECEYAGFEGVFSDQELRIDMIPYRTGVVTVDRSGKRFLCWCRNTDVIRRSKARPIPPTYRTLDQVARHVHHADTSCFVDACNHEECFYKISGFAFKQGNDHYRYAKSLVLIDPTGTSYELAVQLDERVDVAYTFPREHFLYYTGFVCYVFDGMLEAGNEYEVMIRLRNVFDPEDIRDIMTDEKVIGRRAGMTESEERS